MIIVLYKAQPSPDVIRIEGIIYLSLSQRLVYLRQASTNFFHMLITLLKSSMYICLEGKISNGSVMSSLSHL